MKYGLLFSVLLLSSFVWADPIVFKDIPQGSEGSFAIASDTQETLGIEIFLLRRETNQEDSKVLIEDMARQPIAFLAMLGDFTGWGSSAKRWAYFDQLMSPLTNAGISVVGTLGNHEYFGNNKKALKHAYARFPQLAKKRWYERKHGQVAMLLLDTNDSEYSKKEWNEQMSWVQTRLKELDADPTVKGVLVMAHHPPYTNSTITKDNKKLISTLVTSLNSSQKVLAYFSGHAHGYEHFKIQNIHYLVTGGAGGARVNYLTGKKARHKDLFSDSPDKRPFNYLVLSPEDSGVGISVRGLIKGEKSMKEIDQFFIPFRVP
jgi:predicted MPP superfamily phosphohydrolase